MATPRRATSARIRSSWWDAAGLGVTVNQGEVGEWAGYGDVDADHADVDELHQRGELAGVVARHKAHRPHRDARRRLDRSGDGDYNAAGAHQRHQARGLLGVDHGEIEDGVDRRVQRLANG